MEILKTQVSVSDGSMGGWVEPVRRGRLTLVPLNPGLFLLLRLVMGAIIMDEGGQPFFDEKWLINQNLLRELTDSLIGSNFSQEKKTERTGSPPPVPRSIKVLIGVMKMASPMASAA